MVKGAYSDRVNTRNIVNILLLQSLHLKLLRNEVQPPPPPKKKQGKSAILFIYDIKQLHPKNMARLFIMKLQLNYKVAEPF